MAEIVKDSNLELKEKNRKEYLTSIIFSGIRILVGIVSILLGGLDLDNCDNRDKSNLTVSSWLIGNGIIELVANLHIILNNMLLYFNYAKKASKTIILLTILYYFITPIWLIVGAVIIFRSNVECIEEHSGHVLYALTIWCVHTFYFCVIFGIYLTKIIKYRISKFFIIE